MFNELEIQTDSVIFNSSVIDLDNADLAALSVTTSWVTLEATAAKEIAGVDYQTPNIAETQGQLLMVFNTTNYPITFKHNGAATNALQKIWVANNADYVLQPNYIARLYYISEGSRKGWWIA